MITQPEEYRQRLLDIQNSTDISYMTIPSEEPRFKIGLAEIHYVFSIVNECEYK